VRGQYLNVVLGKDNLIVPTAHHPSPGIGGFVMNGGWGWNWRLWGNGAHHLRAIDVVTADGELIRADETHNSDYLWAARGSGQGFFGVVTNMHLDCHRLPSVWKTSVYVYHEDVIEDLFAWAREMVDEFPPHIEVIASTTAYDRNTGDWAPIRMTLAGLAITDDEEEADAALDLMKTCPVNDKAYFKIENQPTDLAERYALGYAADPAGHRFAADNCYTEAPADVVAPRLKKVFTGHPSPRTHVFYMSGGQVNPLDIDKMALSVQGSVFIGAYTLWTDPAQDEAMARWPVDQMMTLDDISTGGQMNDENMFDHPQNYLSEEAYRKLEALRAKHDPEGVFESFRGSPRKST
jgi:FAD/FMN-containing dehydrogenase